MLKKFCAKINEQDINNCWECSNMSKDGYGTISGIKAHRFAWILFVGNIPNGMFVCHKCDNPACCNPSHLFLGNAKDNGRDMSQKGRGRGIAITDAIVDKVREAYRAFKSYATVGERFNISYTTTREIVLGLRAYS